jgi:hypothetical protein
MLTGAPCPFSRVRPEDSHCCVRSVFLITLVGRRLSDCATRSLLDSWHGVWTYFHVGGRAKV